MNPTHYESIGVAWAIVNNHSEHYLKLIFKSNLWKELYQLNSSMMDVLII